jgi:hypothetical protein
MISLCLAVMFFSLIVYVVFHLESNLEICF